MQSLAEKNAQEDQLKKYWANQAKIAKQIGNYKFSFCELEDFNYQISYACAAGLNFIGLYNPKTKHMKFYTMKFYNGVPAVDYEVSMKILGPGGFAKFNTIYGQKIKGSQTGFKTVTPIDGDTARAIFCSIYELAKKVIGEREYVSKEESYLLLHAD